MRFLGPVAPFVGEVLWLSQPGAKRIYSADQLKKLILICQLIDQDSRPGKLIKLDVCDLCGMKNQPLYHCDEKEFLGLQKQNLRRKEW